MTAVTRQRRHFSAGAGRNLLACFSDADPDWGVEHGTWIIPVERRCQQRLSAVVFPVPRSRATASLDHRKRDGFQR